MDFAELQNTLVENQFGFRWGSVKVTRVASGPRLGFAIRVEAVSSGAAVVVRVSPKGNAIQVLEQ